VKRTFALFTLSQVIATDERHIQVLDWQRLCSVASFDRSRLELRDEDYEGALIASPRDQPQADNVTASGDPACFV
jgi:hypothetical protein